MKIASSLLCRNNSISLMQQNVNMFRVWCCTIATVESEERLGSELKKTLWSLYRNIRAGASLYLTPNPSWGLPLRWAGKRNPDEPSRFHHENRQNPLWAGRHPGRGGGKIFAVLLKAREATKQIRMDASRLSRLEPYNYVLRIVTCVSFSICSQLKE